MVFAKHNDETTEGRQTSVADPKLLSAICDEFEADRRNGRTVDLSQYLDRVQRNQRVGLMDSLRSVERRLIATSAVSEWTTTKRYRPGDSVGRYRIRELLGEGSFGQVYLALDTQLERQIALKIQTARRPDEQFLTEARALARLDHPGIVPVHDFGQNRNGHFFVVSKYLPGGTLSSLICQGPIPWQESARLVMTLADASQHAHNHGIVHRDIKPANILFDSADQPCLVDFGLALRENEFGKGSGFAGSPPYMSPEQARGCSQTLDGRSDVFSLGVVLYEMLTKTRPFLGKGVDEILAGVRNARPIPPRQIVPGLPIEIENVCLRALSKSPDERFGSAREFAEALQQTIRPGRSLLRQVVQPLFGATVIAMMVVFMITRDAGSSEEALTEGEYQLPGSRQSSMIETLNSVGPAAAEATSSRVTFEHSNPTDVDLRQTSIDLSRKNLAGMHFLPEKGVNAVSQLNLTRTGISDGDLSGLNRFPILRDLWLNYTAVTGTGLSELRGSHTLIHLDLNHTHLNDQGVSIVADIPSILWLDASHSAITDSGLTALLRLQDLETLRLKNTELTDDCVSTLLQMKTLKALDVTGTKISASGVQRLHEALASCNITCD